MSLQVVTSDFWELRLPDDWMPKGQAIEHTTYIEAPDGSQGVYVSTWRDTNKPLLTAMLEARAVEQRNLPDVHDGDWTTVELTEKNSQSQAEVRSEYFNPTASYRLVSRILGRGDSYVRLTYHDYDCRDYHRSRARSEPWIGSLRLREAEPT